MVGEPAGQQGKAVAGAQAGQSVGREDDTMT